MSVLTDARFDFGIGTGRPDARGEVEQLGRPWGSGAQRLAQLQETVAHLRELDGEGHTPVLVAAGGPRALSFAAAEADIVTLAAQPATPRAEVAAMADRLRELAGPRAPELSMNVFAVHPELSLSQPAADFSCVLLQCTHTELPQITTSVNCHRT